MVWQYCDLAGNLMREGDPAIRNNQLMQYQGYCYQYDAFGRMKRRTDAQAQRQDYRYNSDNRMVEVRFADRASSRWQRVEYDYDLLGRRTGKRLYGWPGPDEAEPAPERVHFIWDGMRLRGEYSPGKMTDVMYVYNGEGYEPLARVDRLDFRVLEPETPRQTETRIYYYHTGLNGLPEAMTSVSGKLVYEARYALWGEKRESRSAHTVLTAEQNLRFAGQYFDAETGLHYNTFRYYAPECGRFTQPDPIGLVGGLNLYAYAPNPLTWIDPFGLSNNPIYGTPLGDVLGPVSARTGKTYQGQQIFKITSKTNVGGIKVKPGDYYYLDGMHKDHIELFAKDNSAKGVFNLDGSLNEAKTAKASGRRGPGC